jgi:hypothetical protein
MSNETKRLGRLEPVDLRDVWKSESSDFTPWLASEENIALLGKTLGMELEVEASEQGVGPFRADILCKDTANGDWVLIENQLARTDHVHLGQLLTYAAGLKAVTIVWVARKFTEEHRASLDWLNEITAERFQFFGLEVEAWRIGDSAPAPKFNVVSKPNDWSRELSAQANRVAEGGLSGPKRLQLEFWTEFCAFVDEHARRIRVRSPRADSWLPIAIGRSGFHLSAVASMWNSDSNSYAEQELRAELVIEVPQAQRCWEQLQSERSRIEEQLGAPLIWHGPPNVKKRSVYIRRSADLNDRDAWPEYHEWLTRNLDRMHEVFQPRVKNFDLKQFAAQPAGGPSNAVE